MRLALPIAVLLLALSPAATPQVYRWVDAHGVTHYTDAPPPSAKIQSHVLTFHNQTPTQIVQMRMEQKDTQNLAWVDNRMAGPVEVELTFANSTNIVADPPLPLRAVLPAGGSQMLSRFDLATARPEGSFELNITALPGDPNSKTESAVSTAS